MQPKISSPISSNDFDFEQKFYLRKSQSKISRGKLAAVDIYLLTNVSSPGPTLQKWCISGCCLPHLQLHPESYKSNHVESHTKLLELEIFGENKPERRHDEKQVGGKNKSGEIENNNDCIHWAKANSYGSMQDKTKDGEHNPW